MPAYLPIFLDVSQKRVLLVGGGNVAQSKLETLIQFTRNILVVAPEINSGIQSLPGVTCMKQRYSKGVLNGVGVVYACTQDSAVNQQIQKDARKAGVLVNVVDNPLLSDFISPAVYKAGNMTVAVSSGGTNLKQTIAWRDRIHDFFENGNGL